MFVWSLFSAKFLSFLFISLAVYTDQRPCVIIYIPHASPLCCARSSQSELSNEHACHKLLVRGSGVIQAANMSPAYKVTSKVSVARATSALRPSAFAIQRTKKQTQVILRFFVYTLQYDFTHIVSTPRWRAFYSVIPKHKETRTPPCPFLLLARLYLQLC